MSEGTREVTTTPDRARTRLEVGGLLTEGQRSRFKTLAFGALYGQPAPVLLGDAIFVAGPESQSPDRATPPEVR